MRHPRLPLATIALVLGALPALGCSDDSGDPTDGKTNSTTTTEPEPAALCQPSGGGPHWLLEGETVIFQVGCATDMVLPDDAFEVTSLPEGATYDATKREVAFSPGFDQAAVYEVEIHVAETSETAQVKIGVADAWDHPSNVPVVDPTRYTEEYGLPVLFLQQRPVTDEYVANTFIYRGHTYTAEAKLRGASSLGYPKNSYTLKFSKQDRFQEPDEADGFTNKRKIVLTTPFDDNSYVRQRLAYDLWNRLDPGHVQIQTYSAVVYIEGEYWGLYTVGDHVDKDLMEQHGFWDDGNLYKAINHDANFDTRASGGGPKGALHAGYEKKEGFPEEGEPGAFSDLEELVQFVATSDAATFRSQIGSRIDRRDYENWWIFVTFIKGSDSAGKNSYHYRDPRSNGVFRFMPWDFNESFGQTWQSERTGASEVIEYRNMNRLFDRFLEEPSIAGPLKARYAEVLHGVYSESAVQALVDGYIARIDTSARRDEQKWGQAYQTYGGWAWRNNFTTYEEEVAYLKAWISERWRFQDALY
ncbi:CotH kinase family protein [Chondromyces crocatus]|uniref:Lipoprotein n=1 Tax=Chondromyces crocatus TaxID=52 RepID=A0A0K1EC75_CHOCO|nr:CotH kinase family protein [Chondromyces crocatus]AKT38459.1 uncharacterized protein CMC5_026060 [Chondromyces crocatus]